MSKRTEKNGEYLSDETISELNDQHGWFQYEDAQSDVSRAFANNAVHAFIEIAKEAECAKQETGMSPSELVAHLQDMQSRIAELEKDSARLDWFDKVGEVHICRVREGHANGALRWDVEYGHYGDLAKSKKGMRQAIDAAMQKD